MTKIEAKQAGSPGVSPAELLRAAVTGKTEAAAAANETAASPAAARFTMASLSRLDPKRFAVPGATLAIGVLLGGGVMALSRPASVRPDALAALETTLDAGRTETVRLAADIAQLHTVLADLRASTDGARKEAASRSTALGERLAQVDKSLNGKISALGERLEQVERDHNTRLSGLAAQLDRRAAAKAEPTQTGSIGEPARAVEAKPEVKVADAKVSEPKPKPAASDKPPVIEGWALRDVYEGTAILENRRRRLVEVAPGDVIPGVGRVEGVERHGREWVVVTRQGLVTAQAW
ncbi:hypothetical protein ABID82_005957 [Methylobacterium sp. PvP062]|uniref:Uncharacterized protein n=1 Tax=Methylobacterium radiotolerans TaxID=31998 RepID=A0ABV2NM14_9HYPH|nr:MULTISPECIES: hypothetical protein [unclassified Methylobacterium]MBP2495728.1 hypothetical protein [Methylobacterium sp. PvP105]MBP2504401.1 hypothetical protein [Methylobacterium sp. PvP109]MCX7332009.1 hypothetical protein [Hyphomicrobiales bacterium]